MIQFHVTLSVVFRLQLHHLHVMWLLKVANQLVSAEYASIVNIYEGPLSKLISRTQELISLTCTMHQKIWPKKKIYIRKDSLLSCSNYCLLCLSGLENCHKVLSISFYHSFLLPSDPCTYLHLNSLMSPHFHSLDLMPTSVSPLVMTIFCR